jgi:hypothetical protein
VVEKKSINVRTPRPVVVLEAPSIIADKIILSDYEVNALNNVVILKKTLENIRDFIPLIIESLELDSVSLDSSQAISPQFIRKLIGQKGIQSFMTLVSTLQKNELDGTSFSQLFERMYGVTPIEWYLTDAAPKVLAEYETNNLEAIIIGLTFEEWLATTGLKGIKSNIGVNPDQLSKFSTSKFPSAEQETVLAPKSSVTIADGMKLLVSFE